MQRPAKKEHLKQILVRERLRRELTQECVAEAVGASPRNYQRWEQGLTFPQPYYLQQLREFFGPCIDEVTAQPSSVSNASSEAPFRGPQEPAAVHGDRKYRRIMLSAIFLILALSAGTGVFLHITYPYGFAPVRPGGAWISPTGSTVGNIVHFAAYAYPTHNGEPAIDHVNFTAYWPGVDPRVWKIVCVVRQPVHQDVYACVVNLQLLGAPAGQIIISFDVYDRQGNANLAPNGKHRVMYAPGA